MGTVRNTPTLAITPVQRLRSPEEVERTVDASPVPSTAEPSADAATEAAVQDQSTINPDLTASQETSNAAPLAAAERTREAVAGQDVNPSALATFQAGELPAVSPQVTPETLTQWNQTLMDQAVNFQMPARSPDQQQSLDTLKQDLDQAEVGLQAAIAQADGPEREGLEHNLAQVQATRTRLNAFEGLDQARRQVIDAPNLAGFRQATTAMETAQQTFVAQMTETESVLPDSRTDNEAILAITRRDVEDLTNLIDHPDAGTTQMTRALDRGGYTPESRFDNFRRFNLMRTDRHQYTRNRENETVNAPGYVQSLRNDMADSASRQQQYARLSRDIQGANPPLSEQQIGRRVRSMLSTESGRSLVVTQQVFNSLEASFQAEGDAVRARTQIGQAEGQLTQASTSLGQGNAALSQRDMTSSRALFDQARAEREQAGALRNNAADNNASATTRANVPVADGLPPAERQNRAAANAQTLGSVAQNQSAIAGFDQRASTFDADLGAAEAAYTQTEADIAAEAERMARVDARLQGTPYREELKSFLQDVMQMSDSGSVEGSITARAGVGTANLNVTAGLSWKLIAEKAWGQGSSFTLRSDITVSAELRANVGFMDFKAGMDASMQNGIHMRNEEEAAEFIMLTSDVASAYLSGDRGRISASRAAFDDFMGDHRFTGTGRSTYASGEVSTPGGGPSISGGASSSDETSNYWGVDRDGDGDISDSERQLRIQSRDTHSQITVGAGDFAATVGHRTSVVTHSDDPNTRRGDRMEMGYVELALNPAVLSRLQGGETLSGMLASDVAQGLRRYGVVVDSGQLGAALDQAQRSGDYYGRSNSGQQVVVGLQIENNRVYPVVGYQYERGVGAMAQAGPGVVVGAEAAFKLAGRTRIGNGFPVGAQ